MIKPGSAETASAGFCDGSRPENYEKRWKHKNKRDKCRASQEMKTCQHLVVDGRVGRLPQ